MSELALRRPPWFFVVGRTLAAALLAWAFTLVMLMFASVLDAGGALAARLIGQYGHWAPFGGGSLTAHGRAREAPVSDGRLLLVLAAVTVVAVGAFAVRAGEQPLVLNDHGGTSVTRVPEVQLGDLAVADRVPVPRTARLSLHNLGPRDVRVLGVQPARREDGIRVLGARARREWTSGRPALAVMQPYTLAPGHHGELTVLLSDPGCAGRRRSVRLPLDIRLQGGTSRVRIPVPRCR